MSLKVVETDSNQRNKEIEELFIKIKPLLDDGESYRSAVLKVKGVSVSTNRAWFKDLIKYGELNGYPYKDYHLKVKFGAEGKRKPRENRSGLFRVGLYNNRNYATNYVWKYIYYVDYKPIVISHRDLLELRKKVEDKGLKWQVINMDKARASYDFNNELRKHRGKGYWNNKSGVNRVCRHGDGGWRYNFYNDGKLEKSFYRKNPQDLKSVVLAEGFDWDVVDEEKARKNNLL